MFELVQRGYYPLTEDSLTSFVPARPGVYLLSIRLANGVHHTFHTSQSDNLYRSLNRFIEKDPMSMTPEILEYLFKYCCYFTYFVIPEIDYRNEIEKILTKTIDPMSKLKIINCN